MNEVLKAISDRRSIRGYKDEPLKKEQVDALVKAALESPSARNFQPWHFSFLQGRRDILDMINEAAGVKTDIFYGAPLVVFISAAKGAYFFTPIDCGIAVENLALAAHSMGLGSVILGMPRAAFETDKGEEICKLLKFPEDHEFKIAIAIGIPTTTKEAHPIGEGKVDFVD
ncbi:MAG: nitroreductase [Clostridia bacterium]|nr:nitroreductase [Clostridia bacterium]